MEGGIAILLLVIIVIAAGVAAVFFGGGIGVLGGRRQNVGHDAELTGDAGVNEGDRPLHTAPRNEQDVEFVSSEREGER